MTNYIDANFEIFKENGAIANRIIVDRLDNDEFYIIQKLSITISWRKIFRTHLPYNIDRYRIYNSSLFLYYMVAHFTIRTYGGNQTLDLLKAFGYIEIRFFKRPI